MEGYKVFNFNWAQKILLPTLSMSLFKDCPFEILGKNKRLKGFGPFAAFKNFEDALNFDVGITTGYRAIFKVKGKKSRVPYLYAPTKVLEEHTTSAVLANSWSGSGLSHRFPNFVNCIDGDVLFIGGSKTTKLPKGKRFRMLDEIHNRTVGETILLDDFIITEAVYFGRAFCSSFLMMPCHLIGAEERELVKNSINEWLSGEHAKKKENTHERL